MNEISSSASIPLEAELREGKPSNSLLIKLKLVVPEHGRTFLKLLQNYDARIS
jgi:hypothetical protein